jgi:hypothetical protein
MKTLLMDNEASKYTLHPHQHKNVNIVHKTELAVSGFNQRIAVALTRAVGTMPCAYIFVCLAIAGFPGLHASLPAYVQWVSQTFLQLVFLPVLSVGQSVLARHQELQADEAFNTTTKIFSDVKTIIKQNDEIIKILRNQNNEAKQ